MIDIKKFIVSLIKMKKKTRQTIMVVLGIVAAYVVFLVKQIMSGNFLVFFNRTYSKYGSCYYGVWCDR